MPLSQEELYGATKANKKKKSDETGFFEAAAAGVVSGLIKIPEGIVSLGAELMDLGLGTEMAKDVEKYFDDLNPFDEIAESRGIGKITQALASIGPVAIKGATLGVKAASAIRASNLAKRALAAKKAGKAVSLSKFGQVLQKGQDIVTTPLAGGIIGSGVGESLVADEDIGTLGDMLKGTSLEPFAITMMDTESKEGRSEAFRRLTNRIKFGTEGALFNLGITKAGQGVKKLREPATYGLERWKEGGIMASVEKALYGLKPAFAGTQAGFEAQQLGLDLTKAAKSEAATEVAKLHKAIDDVVPKLDKSLDLNKDNILKEFQDILQPLPGKKLETIKLEELPNIIENMSGVKNKARDSFKYKYSGEGAPPKELNKAGKELYEDFINMGKDDGISLTGPKQSPMSEQEFITKMTIEAPNKANKYVVDVLKDKDQTRRLITPEKIIGDQGQMGFFSIDDYAITPGGKADKFLSKIEKGGGGKRARDEIENKIKTWRATVDNLTGKISQKNLKVDLSKTLHAELGNYLTADYYQFNQATLPLFRVNRNVAAVKEPALKAYMEQEKNAYRIAEAETLKKTPGKEGIKPEDIIIPQKKLDQFSEEGASKIEKYLRAKNLEELDPIRAAGTEDGLRRYTGDAPNQATKQAEKDAITIQTSVLQRKKLDEWEEIVLGRVKDPTVTFMSSVSKMASLNYTLDYVNTIAKQGSTKSGSVVVEGGVTKFLNSVGEEINIQELTADNIKKGRVKQNFFDENGKYYTPEETLALATKETENLLKTEFDKSKYIFGKGDAMGEVTSAADDLVRSGNAKNIEEAVFMLRDPKQFKQVKSTGMDGLSALDGKWMQAPKYDTVFDTTSNWLSNLGTLGTIYKYGILGPKTVSQISKTVLNGLTHVRNFISAGAFVSANGAIVPMGGDFKALLPTSLGGDVLETGKIGKGAIETSRRMSAQRLNPAGKRQRLNTKEDIAISNLNFRSARVGVGGGTQAEAGEIARQVGDFGEVGLSGLEDLGNKTMRKLYKGKGILKKGYEKTTQLYVEEDTFHKNINWFLERNRFEKIFNDLGVTEGNFKEALKGKGVSKDVQNFLNDSVERFYNKGTREFDGNFELFLDEVGGKLTRNNIPNYAYVGRFGRALRMSPFGNFIAFPLEIMRTGSNIVDTAIKEMSSKIPAVQKLGQRRLASFAITVGGIPQALKQTMMAVHDVSNEEMEALRRVVPEWSKNSTLIPAGRDKDGYLKYQDFSYSNAYDFLLRPIRAVNNAINEGKNDGISLKAAMGEGLQDGFSELLQPFASESILSEAVIDSVIRGGVGKDGRRVWAEEDEPFEKMIKAMGHIGKQVVPMGSTFKQLERISLAARDRTGEYGEEYKLKDELPGLFGFRITNANPERSLQFKIGSFGSSLKKTENLFTTPLLKGGRVSPQDVIEGYQYSEAQRFQILKQMAKDIEAMRDLGMKDFKIEEKLKARKGLSKDVISDLMFGVYTPKSPSDFFINRMGEINRDLNKKEGISVPNPYYQALPFLNRVINNNRRINLLDEDISFSQLNVGAPQTQSVVSKIFNNDGPVRSNVSSATPQLAAAGTNTSLTQPLKVEDVFKTGIV